MERGRSGSQRSPDCMERLLFRNALHEPGQVQTGCLVGQETLEKPPARGQMAGLPKRELAKSCERQYGRSRAAPSVAKAQSVRNRGPEPLVHPSRQETVLAGEEQQGQTRIILGSPSCAEDLADPSVSVHPVLDRDSLPASLPQNGEVGPWEHSHVLLANL